MGMGCPRIAERIRRWEFMEMHNSRSWRKGQRSRPAEQKARSVWDIEAWLQCFVVFVSVVSRDFPKAVPELMAYMVNIIRASQEYEGAAWEAYDTAFCRQRDRT